jgi:hypothetical protein
MLNNDEMIDDDRQIGSITDPTIADKHHTNVIATMNSSTSTT